jgi:gamma-glutamyltranspeptidase/glutathione hydrolase
MRCLTALLTGLVLSVAGCSGTPPTASRDDGLRVDVATSYAGMVSSNCDHASAIGVAVLARGGNAVDAAIAVQFALAVTWPEAGNIGGGGFMMIAEDGSEEVVCIDYRETAPGASTAEMYAFGENRHHHRHVGVPGSVAGMATAWERYGTLPWIDLVMPSVELAREGFEVNEHLAGSVNRVLQQDKTRTAANLAELRRVYSKADGTAWQAGDVMTLPDLANTLETIAHEGADGFYHGRVAEALAADMAANGGLITEADLNGYRSEVRPAIRVRYRGHDVYGAPPPSSGGVTIGLMLNMLESFDTSRSSRFGVQRTHLMAEVMKRAFSERAKHLGDPGFVDVPVAELTSKPYAHRLAASISMVRPTPSDELAAPIELAEESPSTTHFSVIDASGMGVSNTTTLEQAWGSRVIPAGLGFVLNNEMGDFNWKPGYTDRTGKIGTPANVIEPGKRMLSSMSPTIVKRDGSVVALIGSPGGRTIINTVLGILISTIDDGLPLAEAVEAPRMHHQWLPEKIVLEADYPDPTVRALRALGHEVELREGSQGAAHCIAVDSRSGLITGVADYRRGGSARSPESIEVETLAAEEPSPETAPVESDAP